MIRISRVRIAIGIAVTAILGGALVHLVPERARELNPDAVTTAPADPAVSAYAGELHDRFQQAIVMLHAGQPQHALTALERVIALAPRLPEARVNAGFALFELSNFSAARVQFHEAIALRPEQVNAYYGLAMALEALGDLDGALGAMRTYVHLADQQDTHVRKAQSAIWEWQNLREQRLAAGGDDAGAGHEQPSAAVPGEGG